jgi:5-methylthioadenosine/S-adenosylhomocysteine deaminase
MESVDTLLSARWIVPVEPSTRTLESHSIAIRDGRIVAVLPTSDAERRYSATQRIERPEHAVLPGLINAHTHAPMTLLRGCAEDRPLMPWLQEVVWPLERRWLDPEFVHDGALLAIAEMLRAGVTCFGDMYFWPDVVARTAAESHMRAAIGLVVVDAPTGWCATVDEYFDKGLRLHDEYRGDPLISTLLAPHSPYAVGDESLRRIGRLADELEIPVMTHLHESTDEIERSVKQHGCRPLARLQRLGLVTPQLIAVHFVHATEEDMETLAVAGASVVHCPESNLKLGNGVSPLPRLLEHGLPVALGTDGAASNNDLDVLAEARTAGLLAAGVTGTPGSVRAADLLRLATLEGARALGLGDSTGSIVAGKWADLCCIDLSPARSQPVHDVSTTIVYSCNSSQVTDTWVAGRHVYGDDTLFYIDEDRLRGIAERWRRRMVSGPEASDDAATAAPA